MCRSSSSPSSYRSVVRAFVGLSMLAVALGCGSQIDQTTPLDEAKQLLFKERFAEARAKCDQILAEDPGDYGAILFRGQVNHKEGTMKGSPEGDKLIQDAMADYTRAIELGPQRPDGYDFRYHLYMELANKEPDRDAKRLLEEAAAADYNSLRQWDPSAHLAFKNETRVVPESLKNPIPVLESDSEVLETVDLEPNPFEVVDDQNAFEEPAADQTAKSDDSDSDSDRGRPARSAEEWIAKGADDSDEEEITKLDLGHHDEEEPTLPPHSDPLIGEVPELPLPHITRFDRQSFLPPPSPFDPRASGGREPSGTARTPAPKRATTGIKGEEDPLPDQQEPRRGRFFLQNQISSISGQPGVPTAQLRSTGFHSGSSVGISSRRSPLLGGIHQGQIHPSGFLPPGAQGNFGPQLGPRNRPPGPERGDGTDTPPRRRSPRSGAPILTTAIPGTTMIFGANGNRPTANRYAPDLTDPNYTPFVPRQTGIQTVPDLPRE